MSSMLHSAQQFRSNLLALGLKAGDTVMMHSSFKSLGGIEGGAETVFVCCWRSWAKMAH